MGKLRAFVLLLLYTICCNISAQQYYSKLYIQNRPAMIFGSVEVINDNMYVSGVTNTIASPYYDKALFGKINADGTVSFIDAIIDSNQYSYDIFLNSLKRTKDGNFIATGNMIDTAYKAFLMKVDTNGRILLWHEYTYPNALLFDGPRYYYEHTG